MIGSLVAVTSLGCGSPQPASDTQVDVDALRPARGLAYQLTLDTPANGGALQIEMTLHTAPIPDPLIVAFPFSWAGRDAFFDDIVAIRADDGQRECPTLRLDEGRVEIRCGATDTIRVRYTVDPRNSLLTESSRFYALSSADRFYGPGHAIFAQPIGVDSDVYEEININLIGTEEWPLHGTIESLDVASMEELVNASFFGGAFEETIVGDESIEVRTYVQRGVRVPDYALAQNTLDIVNAQATMLGPVIARRTTVVALLRDDDRDLMTGNGREGGFVLELGDRIDAIDDELVELVAHENLHRLNGHELTFAANDEFGTLWFREGVTDYLGVRSAVDAEIVDEDRLFQHIGTALTMYRGNPIAQTVAGADLSEQFWADRDYRRLPYDKGSLIGLVLDIMLHEQDRGGLVAFMRFLATDDVATSAPLSNVSLQFALERFTGHDWTEFFDAYIYGTEWLPVFEQLNSIGLSVVERLEPAPYYGFRTNVTSTGEWYVSEVSFDSPAARAGLSEGMRLTAEPLISDNAGGTAHLQVASAGSVLDVRVPASSGQRRAYAILSNGGEYRLALGLLP